MFIKFDELELFEFFEKEPANIGEHDEGNWIYSYSKNSFEIILTISIYDMNIATTITYNDNIIYNQKHDNVIEIRKTDSDNLRVLLDREHTINIKKEPQIGVVVE